MPTRKKTVVRKANPARKPVEKKSVRKSGKLTESTKPQATKMPAVQMKTYLRNPRLWVGVGVIVIAVLVVAFRGLFVAAVVNGQPVSRIAVVSSLEKQGGKQALDNLIIESLVTQEAQKRNITVTQSDLDAQVSKIEAQLKTQGMTLDEALAAQGLSRSDLVSQLRIQEMLSKMVGTSVKVSDADIQSYIDKNKDSLPTDLSDADLKAQVKTQLEQQQLQDKTQAFVSDLQKKANITYFVNY